MDELDTGRALKLDWQIPEEWQVSPYATNFVVQFSGHEYVLAFFSVVAPILIGPPDEIQQRLDQIEPVPAQCIARVTVSPGRFGELVKLLVNYAQPDLKREIFQALIQALAENKAEDKNG